MVSDNWEELHYDIYIPRRDVLGVDKIIKM